MKIDVLENGYFWLVDTCQESSKSSNFFYKILHFKYGFFNRLTDRLTGQKFWPTVLTGQKKWPTIYQPIIKVDSACRFSKNQWNPMKSNHEIYTVLWKYMTRFPLLYNLLHIFCVGIAKIAQFKLFNKIAQFCDDPFRVTFRIKDKKFHNHNEFNTCLLYTSDAADE